MSFYREGALQADRPDGLDRRPIVRSTGPTGGAPRSPPLSGHDLHGGRGKINLARSLQSRWTDIDRGGVREKILRFRSDHSAGGGLGLVPGDLRHLSKGDVPAVKAVIEKSPRLVDARDGDGSTPLHYAAFSGDPDLVRFLIDKGAKVGSMDAKSKTPLHIAVMNDRREAAAALLERGAAVEARDDYQRTALVLCARERGQASLGRVLIEAGADVNAKDKFGSDALELAAWRGKRISSICSSRRAPRSRRAGRGGRWVSPRPLPRA